MDAVVLRGKRRLVAWVGLVLLLIAATRLAVVLIAVNWREELPYQILSDAIAVAAVLHIAFYGGRVDKWLGVLLFAVWGLASLWVGVRLGEALLFSVRGGVIFLLAVGAAGVVVQALALLTAAVCLGFAGALTGSHSINRYFAYRQGRQARR